MPKILTTLISLFIINIAQATSLQEMQTELDSKQYAKAVTTGLELLRQQPDDPRLQFMTAFAFQKNNQAKQAIHYYEKIISAHPELPEPRNNLAIIYLQKGEYDEAVKLLIASLNTNLAYATAYKNLNSIYQGLASKAYRKALSDDLSPTNVLNKIQLTELSELQQPVIVDSIPTQAPTQIAKFDTQLEAPAPAPAAPAKKPIITKAEVKPVVQTAADENQLIQFVKNWANAWSEQQFDQYVSAYSASYRGEYPDHEEWLKQRRKRVVRADKIKVSLSNFKVKSNSPDIAVIDFHQAYQSSTYHDNVLKRIQLNKINNDWKISREVTLAIL